MTTTRELIGLGADRLRAAGCETPRLDAELLLAHAIGVERTTVVAHGDAPVGPGAEGTYLGWIGRREAGEPVAYIRGFKEFHGIALAIDARALIPRPETEALVDLALVAVMARLTEAPVDALPGIPRVRLIDVGTGSGAIAVALAVTLRKRRGAAPGCGDRGRRRVGRGARPGPRERGRSRRRGPDRDRGGGPASAVVALPAVGRRRGQPAVRPDRCAGRAPPRRPPSSRAWPSTEDPTACASSPGCSIGSRRRSRRPGSPCSRSAQTRGRRSGPRGRAPSGLVVCGPAGPVGSAARRHPAPDRVVIAGDPGARLPDPAHSARHRRDARRRRSRHPRPDPRGGTGGHRARRRRVAHHGPDGLVGPALRHRPRPDRTGHRLPGRPDPGDAPSPRPGVSVDCSCTPRSMRRRARDVVAWTRMHGLDPHLNHLERFILRADDPNADDYSAFMGARAELVPDLVAAISHPVTKVLAVGEPPLPVEPRAACPRPRSTGAPTVTISHPRFLEFVAPGVSKGRAVRWLARRLGVPLASTLAIGDQWNDLEMLAEVGHGAAMPSAPAGGPRRGPLHRAAARGRGGGAGHRAARPWRRGEHPRGAPGGWPARPSSGVRRGPWRDRRVTAA